MYSGTQTKDLQKLIQKLMDESSKHPLKPTEIEDLRKVLRFHEYRYYVIDDPLLADYEYDQLYKQLESLEKVHPELFSEALKTAYCEVAPKKLAEKMQSDLNGT